MEPRAAYAAPCSCAHVALVASASVAAGGYGYKCRGGRCVPLCYAGVLI